MTDMKQSLVYTTKTYTEGGYDFFEITVQNCYVSSIADRIIGTIDNKAGYEDEAAAKAMFDLYSEMRNTGFDTEYGTMTYGAYLTFKWMKYDSVSYCSPDLKMPANIESAINSSKVLEKICKKNCRMKKEPTARWDQYPGRHFETPESLIAILDKMKVPKATEFKSSRFWTTYLAG